MTDHPTGLSEELQALGHAQTVRVADDLADRVLARIATPVARKRKWRRVVATIAALLLAIGVSAAVSAPVRAAIVHVFRFGGVEVRQEPGPAPASSAALPGEHATDLAGAGREVGFRVRVPAALGAPTSVTVADGRVVSLRYGRADSPVRIDEFAGDLGVTWEKYAAAGMATRTSVNGHEALWFAVPVTLTYVDADGTEHTESARQTHGTLIWIDGGLTFRIDGIRPLDKALTVARGMS